MQISYPTTRLDQAVPEILWASDHALLVRVAEDTALDAQRRVLALLRSLRRRTIPGLRDVHPAYRSLLVTFDPLASDPERFESALRELAEGLVPEMEPSAPAIEIPVCYAPSVALDLEEVARSCGLPTEEVVALHSSALYRVHFLGFVAGFPYLGGLPERLAVPRLAQPRKRVPAGSVAIAGNQAGIYPFSTPGGWRIVGRTSRVLFRAEREPPALLAPGDRVRFVRVSEEELGGLATE